MMKLKTGTKQKIIIQNENSNASRETYIVDVAYIFRLADDHSWSKASKWLYNLKSVLISWEWEDGYSDRSLVKYPWGGRYHLQQQENPVDCEKNDENYFSPAVV